MGSVRDLDLVRDLVAAFFCGSGTQVLDSAGPVLWQAINRGLNMRLFLDFVKLCGMPLHHKKQKCRYWGDGGGRTNQVCYMGIYLFLLIPQTLQKRKCLEKEARGLHWKPSRVSFFLTEFFPWSKTGREREREGGRERCEGEEGSGGSERDGGVRFSGP